MATPKKLATERKYKSPAADKERAIEIACKRYSERALKVLVDAMTEDGVDIRWKIQAAKEILDRAWGRARQSLDANVTVEGSEALINAINAGKARITTPKD